MSNDSWTAVDHYLTDRLASNEAAEAALKRNHSEGLPPIDVSAPLGRFLEVTARSIRARRILEIGTLGGYSTIWMARALPTDGRLISLEIDPKHADVARKNIDAAGLGARVDIRVGKALDSLAQLDREKVEPFDMAFIDADKANNPEYFRWALDHSRPGSILIVDNVVREGALLDESGKNASVVGARRLMDFVRQEKRVVATALQTVGTKGWDGFLHALVL